MPRDRFQREINYLRISLTDHCNLRCVYCMPLRGLHFVPSEELLSANEIERVVQAAASLGFDKIRLTGGEPTLRGDLVAIVEKIAAVPGIRDVAMTTNAILLPGLARDLVAAGLTRINVHIDSLHPERFKRVMRFGSLEQAWRGIEAAENAGLHPLKLNCVVVRDYNDHDVVDLARLTLERDWHVRFIELMPLGSGECSRLSLAQFVPTAETRARIETALGSLASCPSENRADESRNYTLRNARGVIGFISPVSEPYCGACNRMRLTCDGKLHLCLLHDDELDVRAALRGGGGIETVREILLRAVAAKPTGHQLDEGIYTERKAMFQIGG
ncbi:MAG TPA: GTP 3',8-cyclase MoaA [Phycisphaerae bacterium]|jgi:cyclic pyranopterin phosphate synthase